MKQKKTFSVCTIISSYDRYIQIVTLLSTAGFYSVLFLFNK